MCGRGGNHGVRYPRSGFSVHYIKTRQVFGIFFLVCIATPLEFYRLGLILPIEQVSANGVRDMDCRVHVL